jgi:starch-binding outer membrane protein, SusD/RagB family
MKKYWIAFLLIPLWSCTDVLQQESENTVGSYIWDDYDLSELYLDVLYNLCLPGASWDAHLSSTVTDEALGSGTSNYLWGNATIDDATDYSATTWSYIRKINIMITEMDNSTLDSHKKNLLLGQAHFLRAIRYWELVRLYGGVPIVKKPLDFVSDTTNIGRSTTKESVEFILEDLDFAISSLPANWSEETSSSDYGRLTSLAAKAYKGRVQMTFASPMFCERDAYTAFNGEAVSAYSIPDTEIQERWEDAYQTNKSAYDSLISNGCALAKLEDLFTTEAISNTEAVMVNLYTGVNFRHDWELTIRPSSMEGVGYNVNPTWDLAEAFPMVNGKSIDESGSGYLQSYYWLNRDPRFYATLAYNTCNWDMGGTSGRIQWIYKPKGDSASEEKANLPVSAFYCRKAQDASIETADLQYGKTDWMEIRLAEVMLNLAECANEMYRLTGDVSYANTAVSMERLLRKRAGIEQGDDADQYYGVYSVGTYPGTFSSNYEYLLDLIMEERFIEFAFENQRYWDLRRRMMYTRNLSVRTLMKNGSSRNYLKVGTVKDANFEVTKSTVTITSSNYYTYFRDPSISGYDVNKNTYHVGMGIDYLPDYYFMPMPTNAFSNNDNMLQTIGWSDGSFDPLAE